MEKRECSQGEMIEWLLADRSECLGDHPVFVEIGSGVSTIHLSRCGRRLKASVYSLDINAEKIDALRSKAGDRIANVEFVVGNSLDILPDVVEGKRIDFLFLDSAASALHTLHEFLICEPHLHPGACVLIDNAAMPAEKRPLSPARKGKILVPYLLASSHWKVRSHPRAGGSMVSAIYCADADFADPDYENPRHVDHWQEHFDIAFR